MVDKNKSFVNKFIKFIINITAVFIPFRKTRHKFKNMMRNKTKKFEKNIMIIKKSFGHHKHKYDLIIPLGDRCQVSFQMRQNFLQIHTYPFDWLRKGNINTIQNLFRNDFYGFLDIDYLVPIERRPVNLVVYDKKTEFEFLHDFEHDTIEEDYKEVLEKYRRRIKRLDNNIKHSRSVLFIYRNDTADKADILELYDILSSKYPKTKMEILWIVAQKGQNDIVRCRISPNIKKAIFDADAFYGIWPTSEWEGNENLYATLFQDISLTLYGCIRGFLCQ